MVAKSGLSRSLNASVIVTGALVSVASRAGSELTS
jgi:hypothetical protein